MAHGRRRIQERQEPVGQEPVRLLGAVRRRRSALLLGTALQASAALLLATPGRAQPAPNARPSGGVVTAGSATIGSSPSTTTITQSSQLAAINWQSFDVGAQQTVDFVQPSSSAMALNRVIGPNPSQIAGRIDANGQIILINQSGVIFYQGAQVNSAGLIVSAAGMSDANFMAGKLVFDQPAQPNAAVVNQGTLTVTQAGLAALVAPQVANSGVITAKLGHVVLAGANTATLDLYGDGLVSLDVTNEVTQAPIGPDGKPVTALVTNSGVIRADGGTVQLTAREADGLVQTLVQAGGTITANSVGAKTGTIVLGGLGGSIVLTGEVSAAGSAAGSTGGQVQVDASQGVTLAAGSRISASGPAGGGTVAIGTTLARAKGGPGTASALTAGTVQIAQGASIAANATATGNGGRVTVLSSQATNMAGTISAKGGPQGGDGGFVETSGEQGFALTGSVDVSAPLGNLGTILLDPANLTIVAGSNGSGDQDTNLIAGTGTLLATVADTTNDQVSNGAIELLTGNIVLQAITNLTVSAPIDLTTSGQALTLQAGNNLVVQAGGAITTSGNITLSAGDSTITGFNAAGGLTLSDTVSTSAGTVKLSSGSGGISLNSGAVLTGQTIDLDSGSGGIALIGNASVGQYDAVVDLTAGGAGVTEYNSSVIIAATLQGNVAGPVLLGNGNTVTSVGSFAVTGGTTNYFSLEDTGTLAVTGPLTATGDVGLDVIGTGSGNAITVSGSIGSGGTLFAGSGLGNLALVTGAALTGPTISLQAEAITLTGNASVGGAGSVVNLMTFGGAVSEASTSIITAATLQTGGGGSLGGMSLLGTQNAIDSLGPVTVYDGYQSFLLVDSVPLTVTGPVNLSGGVYQSVVLEAGGTITVNGSITASGDITLATGGAGPLSPPPTAQSSPLIAVLGGDVTSTGGSVNLLSGPGGTVGIGLAVVGGPETTGTLAAASGQRVTLQTDTLLVGKVASIAAPDGTIEIAPATQDNGIDFATAAAGTLTIPGSALAKMSTGTLRIGAVTINGTETTTAGAITFDAPVDLTGIATTLDLQSGGAVSQNAADILTVPTLTAVGTAINLPDANNAISVATNLRATVGDIVLVDDPTLVLTGSQSGNNLFFEVTAAGGTLQVGSNALGATLTATAASNPRISLVADNLTEGSAPSTITAAGGSVELAPFTATTALSLAGSAGSHLLIDTTLLGDINTGTLVVGGFTDVPALATSPAASAASISIDGAVDLTGHATTLLLLANGPISEPGGPLTVNTLAADGGVITLDNPSNAVSVLADVSGTSFLLDDATDLLVSAVLNAADITLRALASQISLGDGASIITGGSNPGSPGPLVAALEPSNGAPGAYIEAASFTQIGSSTLSGQAGGPATLQISTSQSTQFDPSLGLQGGGNWLILDLGGGTAAGNIYVGALNVTYSQPGSADLSGTINGVAGPGAAAYGFIQPAVSQVYLFNGCQIGTPSCHGSPLSQQQNETAVLGTLSPFLPGMPPPLIGLTPLVLLANPLPPPPAGALTDPDVVPPNVSYVDY